MENLTPQNGTFNMVALFASESVYTRSPGQCGVCWCFWNHGPVDHKLDPDFGVTVVGKLDLSLQIASFQALIGQSRQSPLGRREATIVDTTVRKSWDTERGLVVFGVDGGTQHRIALSQTAHAPHAISKPPGRPANTGTDCCQALTMDLLDIPRGQRNSGRLQKIAIGSKQA